ncbi:hypothetical protein EJ08DRAFT_687610 [Tothia fuscella]|uniref:Uncharacterized protein n=1 Tax=Tothia fuscella TaxID=1048955 RepID=A0A9P4NRP8_9PEZI|nr:hypothetical protein EJ08DRAFT_687610 [Tothia fuscella]
MSGNGFLSSFSGAVQASVSVLLTIFVGVLLSQLNFLNESSAKEISATCVKVFLPALLFEKLGSNLHFDTALRYVPVLVWSVTYNVTSIIIGIVATRVFKLPTWVTPAIALNNTTSLPLLLFQALEATGMLSGMLMGSSDSISDAVKRAEPYFLVNAVVSDCLTFAVGPKLLNGLMGNSPASSEDKDLEEEQHGTESGERANEEPHERTSLLPNYVHENRTALQNGAYAKGKHHFDSLPDWLRETLDFAFQFMNAPTIGAVIGALVGLIPALHKAFSADSGEGGVMNAWFTECIKDIGQLFAAVQIIVVGVELSATMRRMKRGESNGAVPWRSIAFITLVRFIIFPLMSIPLFWAFATKTDVLGNDPILWFSIMLMAAGPPAMILLPLADVNGSSEHDKMRIAKFLTQIQYAITPLMSLSVVGSLKATQAAMKK